MIRNMFTFPVEITATIFSTVIEEDLWSFLDSVVIQS